MTFAAPIAFDYRGSRVLCIVTTAITVLAIGALLLSGLPTKWVHALMLMVAVAGGSGAARVLQPQVCSVLWRADGSIEVATRQRTLQDAVSFEAELRGARVLGPLVMLRLRWQHSDKAALWLLPDNTDADILRRLRVRIRAGVDAAGDADQAL